MLTSNISFLPPELMDVVRLFEGAEQLGIVHTGEYNGTVFSNRFEIDGAQYAAEDAAEVQGELQY